MRNDLPIIGLVDINWKPLRTIFYITVSGFIILAVTK